MPRLVKQCLHPDSEQGSAIFLAPLVALIMVYLAGFFVDMGDAVTKADGLDQALSLSAAAASTQISRSAFYGEGLVVLDPPASQAAAVSQLMNSMPKSTVLEGDPLVEVDQGAVCVRARELIKMPFSLIPGIDPYISYSSSSSAVAKGSGTSTAPQC
ncbi:MAG: hypothetical protein EPN30_03435 [Actinomycetota bacterium]|nr:MAG: hypothetical protein EPN30_03435 [Actinomycetota bacterium]